MKTIKIEHYFSPVGELVLGSLDGSLCLCDWANGRKRAFTENNLKKRTGAQYENLPSEITTAAIGQLKEYFDGKRRCFNIPLLFTGTDFQNLARKELLNIPYGTTISYAEQARRISKQGAVRAVASANATNPLSLFVPCHRVVGSDGSLTGYGGGVDVKHFLLDFERHNTLQRIKIRKAEFADLPVVMGLINAARRIMEDNGNLNQWKKGYPGKETIEQDIQRGVCFLCVGETGEAFASFAFMPGPESTYSVIERGSWIDNLSPYYVLHRIASNGKKHGMFSEILKFCEGVTENIRIDTHKDNSIMRNLLVRNGFTFCGIIHISDGSERMAYQRCRFSF